MAVSPAVRLARRGWWPGVAAWVLWALAILGLAVLVWLDQLLRQDARPELVVLTPTAIPPVIGAVSAATVGAVLASRRSRHPVGWLLLALGLSLSAAGVALAYTNYGVARAGAPPAAALVALYVPATILTAIACNGFILLLTPTGTLPSPRWRWWAGVTAATPAALLLVVTLARRPGGRPAQALDSPLDLHALDGGLLLAYQAAFAVAIIANVMATASLVVRFRRARGIQRQQLRWVALATVVAALLSMAQLAASALGAYAAVVLGLGQLLGRDSSLVVAGATLAVAAAFQPARRRVQQVVDRRFDRRRYDAARTIQAFSDRLRQQV